jgi:hypothetical protein
MEALCQVTAQVDQFVDLGLHLDTLGDDDHREGVGACVIEERLARSAASVNDNTSPGLRSSTLTLSGSRLCDERE